MGDENKTGQVTEEQLSKAIDDMIAQHFPEEMNKGGGQPENKMDEVPKDTDLKANGGKDAIKSDNADKDDDKEKLEKEKAMKSLEAENKALKDEVEKLKKAGSQEPQKPEDLVKSLEAENKTLKEEIEKLKKAEGGEEPEDLAKSFDLYKSEITKKFADMGEIFKGLKKEIDLVKSQPMQRQSIRTVDEVKKSFGQTTQGEEITKSDLDEAAEQLVKAGKLPSTVGTELEISGKILNKAHREMVTNQAYKNKKDSEKES